MSGLPGTDIFIAGVFERAAHVPDRSCNNTRNFAERFFYTPETTGTKRCCFIGTRLTCHGNYFQLCFDPRAVLDSSSVGPGYLFFQLPLLVKKQHF
jgi:hypothetical protein